MEIDCGEGLMEDVDWMLTEAVWQGVSKWHVRVAKAYLIACTVLYCTNNTLWYCTVRVRYGTGGL